MRALWLLLLVCGAAVAQDFKSAPILVANTFERENTTVKIAGFGVGGTTVDMNRVTVVLDGYEITGEFQSKTIKSPRATDVKVGQDVPAAVDHNKLLLQWPDGTIVKANIVDKRKRQPPRDRQARD
jgi:hypothetical protein